MATLRENLIARREAIGVELAALDATKAGGLPNTSGGNSTDEVGYKDGLYRELREIRDELKSLNGEEPWEFISEVDT